jgi:hypothetical protein
VKAGGAVGSVIGPVVVVVVLELPVVVEPAPVVDVEVEEVVDGDAPAIAGRSPTIARAATSATAPRDLSSIPLDLGMNTPHLEALLRA